MTPREHGACSCAVFLTHALSLSLAHSLAQARAWHGVVRSCSAKAAPPPGRTRLSRVRAVAAAPALVPQESADARAASLPTPHGEPISEHPPVAQQACQAQPDAAEARRRSRGQAPPSHAQAGQALHVTRDPVSGAPTCHVGGAVLSLRLTTTSTTRATLCSWPAPRLSSPLSVLHSGLTETDEFSVAFFRCLVVLVIARHLDDHAAGGAMNKSPC